MGISLRTSAANKFTHYIHSEQSTVYNHINDLKAHLILNYSKRPKLIHLLHMICIHLHYMYVETIISGDASTFV